MKDRLSKEDSVGDRGRKTERKEHAGECRDCWGRLGSSVQNPEGKGKDGGRRQWGRGRKGKEQEGKEADEGVTVALGRKSGGGGGGIGSVTDFVGRGLFSAQLPLPVLR